MAANLPAGSATGVNFYLNVGVFDDLGTSHTLLFDFTKNAAIDTWNLVVSTGDGTITTGSLSAMTFDTPGNLIAPANQSVGITWTNPVAAAASTIAADFSRMTPFRWWVHTAGDIGQRQYNRYLDRRIVQQRRQSRRPVQQRSQSGHRQTADCTGPHRERTHHRAGHEFTINPNSGDIRLLEANLTDFGSFVPNGLEESTVDLAAEFSDMVIAQRAYSSNAQTIRVADEMTQVATRLKP